MKSKQYLLKKGYFLSCNDNSDLIIPTMRENSGYIFELKGSAKSIIDLLKKKATIEKTVRIISKKYSNSEHKKIKKYTEQFVQKLVKLKIVDVF
jgi:hypothetical protein